MSAYTLHQGDCRVILPTLADASVDAIVSDPPAGIAFMGVAFDSDRGGRAQWIEWLSAILAECLRIARPGSVALIWALPRTSHWTGTAIEDAGWVIEDRLAHLFGCLSDDTEILTPDGWVRYQRVVESGPVLAYNVDTDTFQWETVEDVYVYDYAETAYAIRSPETDQIVSRNHRVLVRGGGGFRFALAEEAALERQVRIPCVQDMRGLLEALPMPQSLSGSPGQGVFSSLLEHSDWPSQQGAEEAVADLSVLRQGISASRSDRAAIQSSQQVQVLLDDVCRSGEGWGSRISSPPVEHRCEKPQGLDGGIAGELSGQDDRIAQPSLERRGDGLQDPRQLRGGPLRAMPARVPGDGAERRLCDGASPGRGADSGAVSIADRGCSSRQSRPDRQRSQQPATLCEQSGSQTVRASRFAHTTLATIEPVFYRGVVWCVKVPSGAFLARRNGKVFITGNSGFPKHKSKLKPSCEDWWLARKPGGAKWLGVDACRIEGVVDAGWCETKGQGPKFSGVYEPCQEKLEKIISHPAGRWPPNTLLSHSPECNGECAESCPVWMLDEQSGERKGDPPNRKQRVKRGESFGWSGTANQDHLTNGFVDSGGASRFFPRFHYQSKASRDERNAWLEGMPEVVASVGNTEAVGRDPTNSNNHIGGKQDRVNRGLTPSIPRANHHPTVKALDLMTWLCRLACPPGGTILDPFAGSGSTGVAAVREGFGFVGIEQDEAYHAIAARRLLAVGDDLVLIP
jgi:DNA modification methylase